MSQRSEIPLQLPHLDLVFIQGGTYQMGTPEDDLDGYEDERPVHKVAVKDFYLSKYPVTQALWRAVMGDDPPELAFKSSGNRPVERVSWDDAQTFIQQLNERTGESYRLPTEAEWEYAARGGIYSNRYKYAGSNKLKEVGWYDENSHDETKPVGLKFPNELGLYDMSGNVYEWCADVWHENYEGAPSDGNAWMEGGEQNRRVVRGGDFFLKPGIREGVTLSDTRSTSSPEQNTKPIWPPNPPSSNKSKCSAASRSSAWKTCPSLRMRCATNTITATIAMRRACCGRST